MDRRCERLDCPFTADVHEVHLRIVEEKMVVERRDCDAAVEQHAHDWIDLVLEHDDVAHEHRVGAAAARECDPGGQSDERLQWPAVDAHRYVGPGLGDLEHAFRLDVRAFQARERFDAFQRFGRGRLGVSESCRCQRGRHERGTHKGKQSRHGGHRGWSFRS